ncbi:hypothetical protein QQ020_17575 [Fulvivirgaceae bacterium BMA12]|uniref:Uncharacterized protein n=1 Tax=Agaribacillus aureus TaxID=3051825 RepID=A0ABT8L802_9BACT|nr:hypothetical protein [Fulvivirgaceae bacterium BMA12]
MARANLELISSIRKAAKAIKTGTKYQWGHMGSCNCGHLVQQITRLTRSEIHEYAMRKYGDWTEQSVDYCATSGQPLDLVISQMLDAGLDIQDFGHLEKLSDPLVLKKIPLQQRPLRHNVRDDVVLYMRTWADLLQENLTDNIQLPSLELEKA